MAHALPFGLEVLHGLDCGVAVKLLGIDGLEFVDDLVFLFEVRTFGAAGARHVLLFLIEEIVTGGKEAAPHLIGMFLGNCTDRLPFLLHRHELVGCLAPFGAVFQRLGTLAQCDLAFEILGQRILHRAEELGLGGKELVATLAETGEEQIVGLARCETDLLPVLLRLDDLLGHLVPGSESRELVNLESLHALTDGLLGLLVLAFAGLALLEKRLIALVDVGREILEAAPDLLAHLFGHRTDVAPLVMQRLETAESGDYILLAAELLSLGHKGLLLGKVFLEVIVAKLLVDLKLVVIFLDSLLIALPEVSRKRSGHLADLLELGLHVAHLLEETVGVVHVGTHLIDLVDDSLLAVIVVLLLRLHGCALFGFLLLDGSQERLEALLHRIGLRLERLGLIAGLDKSLALAALLLVADRIELLLEARNLISPDLGGILFRKKFQSLDKRLLGHRFGSLFHGCGFGCC